jgi:hypothetical protein
MLSEETSPAEWNRSLTHCKGSYGYYGTFALYPLVTANLETFEYDPATFTLSFSLSGENHSRDPTLSNYLSGLEYEDKDYFTVNELRFLMQLSAPCLHLSEDQIEADIRTFRQQTRQGRTMLKSHAKILLKAAVYWRLRYTEKYEDWLQRYIDAYDAFCIQYSEVVCMNDSDGSDDQ